MAKAKGDPPEADKNTPRFAQEVEAIRDEDGEKIKARRS